MAHTGNGHVRKGWRRLEINGLLNEGMLEKHTQLPNAGDRNNQSGSDQQTERINPNGRRKKWVELFPQNRIYTEDTALHKVNKVSKIILDEHDRDSLEEKVGHCLVGRFLGRFPGWRAVKELTNKWNMPHKMFSHNSMWLVFRFQTKEQCDTVIKGGPYVAYGCPLYLKHMPQCFTFQNGAGNFLPQWIQIHGLPLDCWSTSGLSKIASQLGDPLFTDRFTNNRDRVNFARVLVEIDVTQKQPDTMDITLPNGEDAKLEFRYEASIRLCTKCNRTGHYHTQCDNGSAVQKGKEIVNGQKDQVVTDKIAQLPNDGTDVEAIQLNSGQQLQLTSQNQNKGNEVPEASCNNGSTVQKGDGKANGQKVQETPEKIDQLSNEGTVLEALQLKSGQQILLSSQMQNKGNEIQDVSCDVVTDNSSFLNGQASQEGPADPKGKMIVNYNGGKGRSEARQVDRPYRITTRASTMKERVPVQISKKADRGKQSQSAANSRDKGKENSVEVPEIDKEGGDQLDIDVNPGRLVNNEGHSELLEGTDNSEDAEQDKVPIIVGLPSERWKQRRALMRIAKDDGRLQLPKVI